MNKEERVVKYINSADDPVFDGKRYCENDFYNDVEDLAKENQELQQRINKAIEYINSQSPDAGVSGKHIKEILKVVE